MYLSAFELYRIGPGPSSSYTTGPHRAALRFVHELAADGVLPRVVRIEAELYGGLAFHGADRGTHRALVAGFCGHLPERCDAETLELCFARTRTDRSLALGGRHPVRFDPERDLRTVVDRSLADDGNAMRFSAHDLRGELVATRVYFSTGGGAIAAEGEGHAGWSPRVPYAFASGAQLLELGRSHGKRICDLARANECALFSPGEVRAGLLLVAQTMRVAIERGMTSEGRLPSGASRTASAWADAQRAAGAPPRDMCAVYATAMGEESACGGRVVAAPTAATAGPVAALLQVWRDSAPLHQETGTTDFLLTAAAIGGLLRGAGLRQVGCQGEIGVAAAMAASGLACVLGGSNAQVLHAAERALEPHLRLACDPAHGRIEAPCIERGAQGATRAYDAATAAIRLPAPRNGLDGLARTVITAGRAMAARPKSGAIGGLAVDIAEC
ncbi:MAG: serine dehydratase beta chain [Burkholderiales bacterium]